MRAEQVANKFDRLVDEFYEVREDYLDLMEMLEGQEEYIQSIRKNNNQDLYTYLQILNGSDKRLCELANSPVKNSYVNRQMQDMIRYFKYYIKESTKIAKATLREKEDFVL